MGDYFSWGNVEGHPDGSGYIFSQEVYSTTPGAAIEADLSLDQDAARVNLGAPWRMPSSTEFQELIDNCSHVWTQVNGMNGLLFTSNVNGNTIFFPAAGFYQGASLADLGTYGKYWTSLYSSQNSAVDFVFNNSEVNASTTNSRRLGYSVRAVMDPT